MPCWSRSAGWQPGSDRLVVAGGFLGPFAHVRLAAHRDRQLRGRHGFGGIAFATAAVSARQSTRCRPQDRPQDDRGDRTGHLRRRLGAFWPEQAGSQPDRYRQTAVAFWHSAVSSVDLPSRRTSIIAETVVTAPAPTRPLAGRQLCRCHKQLGSVRARGPTSVPIRTSERTGPPYSPHPVSFTKTPRRLHHIPAESSCHVAVQSGSTTPVIRRALPLLAVPRTD